MNRLVCYAFAVYVVVSIALAGVPSGTNPHQAARAWYELGLSHARNGEYDLAKPCFVAVREIDEANTLLWCKSSMALAVTCEAMGSLDEANYYFASDEAKYGEYAARLRNEFRGAWGNVRKIAERSR